MLVLSLTPSPQFCLTSVSKCEVGARSPLFSVHSGTKVVFGIKVTVKMYPCPVKPLNHIKRFNKAPALNVPFLMLLQEI